MNDRPHSHSPAPRERPRWSCSLGRLFGIDVRAHGSLLLLLALVGGSQLLLAGSPRAALLGVLALAALFASILLHELGHALAARRYGIETRGITLLPIGGVAQLERMPDEPREELVVALAGPAVNLGLALVFGLLHVALGWVQPPFAATLQAGLTWLLWANLLLFAFNLLPALPMDGGRVLRALLAMRLRPLRATELAARTGRFLAVGMGVLGLFVNPLLLLIALFVWVGAGQEALVARTRARLAGASVASAMATEFHTLSPTDRVRTAAELSVRSSQRDYPVVHGGRVVGFLSADALKRALAEGRSSSVASVMRERFDTARPQDALDEAYMRLNTGRHAALPVFDGSRLVGLITRENLREFVDLRAAVGEPSAA